MEIRELKRTAKASLKGNWGIAIGIFVIYGIINFVIGNIPTGGIELGSSSFGGGDVSVTADIVSWALQLLIIAPLQAGFNWFYLAIYDQQNPEITRLFDGFKQYGKVVGASFFTGLFVILWSLLFIIPGIIKAISYSQTFFIIKENPNIGVFDAIRESRRMMGGYKWKYALTVLSFIGWVLVPIILLVIAVVLLTVSLVGYGDAVYAILSGILFIISIIYLIGISFYLTPYYQTTIAGFYRHLTNKENSQASIL